MAACMVLEIFAELLATFDLLVNFVMVRNRVKDHFIPQLEF
jgi:hypothetical protein